uniref:Uncharacterized protein n=1 Tax=Spongospora subterranea TaxID=70186 RepID=A0A0H5QXB7_9EUKA|eukprot:CRZ06261.1 hypothetical protein [Spongospora subterranea]
MAPAFRTDSAGAPGKTESAKGFSARSRDRNEGDHGPDPTRLIELYSTGGHELLQLDDVDPVGVFELLHHLPLLVDQRPRKILGRSSVELITSSGDNCPKRRLLT